MNLMGGSEETARAALLTPCQRGLICIGLRWSCQSGLDVVAVASSTCGCGLVVVALLACPLSARRDLVGVSLVGVASVSVASVGVAYVGLGCQSLFGVACLFWRRLPPRALTCWPRLASLDSLASARWRCLIGVVS